MGSLRERLFRKLGRKPTRAERDERREVRDQRRIRRSLKTAHTVIIQIMADHDNNLHELTVKKIRIILERKCHLKEDALKPHKDRINQLVMARARELQHTTSILPRDGLTHSSMNAEQPSLAEIQAQSIAQPETVRATVGVSNHAPAHISQRQMVQRQPRAFGPFEYNQVMYLPSRRCPSTNIISSEEEYICLPVIGYVKKSEIPQLKDDADKNAFDKW